MTEIDNDVSVREGKGNVVPNLGAVLAKIDRETGILHIKGDVPTNDQWELLGQHFTGVRFLFVATGWDENWIDDKFPLNWPLELLMIADAISERISTPVILEGRVKHLVLYFTYGLRFEGPSFEELMKNAKPVNFLPADEGESPSGGQARSEPEAATGASVQAKDEPTNSPSAESNQNADGITILSFPHEWAKWFQATYANKTVRFSPNLPPPENHTPPIRLRTLSILGNDALQQLTYLALAHFPLLAAVESLTICSATGNDLDVVPGSLVLEYLPLLPRLRNLTVTFDDATYAELLKATTRNGKPSSHLRAAIPQGVETLRLRGPASMAAGEKREKDGSKKKGKLFLPRLKRLALLMDLPDSDERDDKAPLAQLHAAHAACQRVLDAAAKRGVAVERFEEPWVEDSAILFRPVDERWESAAATAA
ncbi:hypothetical protein C7999DRAFT_14124 [Corynascus novoguineensis]|uniref:Uncharacterized protein n=1 Tax=Corynascus novoguineensis TaxID=1126955 RepID=A0AAN7CT68_9PEZI|nr:hypothetical protein C7999DRAFT_14124 [Corynascus novoguineensis]